MKLGATLKEEMQERVFRWKKEEEEGGEGWVGDEGMEEKK